MKDFKHIVVWEIVSCLLIFGLIPLCFVIFDHFHIDEIDSQIVIVFTPLLLLAYFAWKRHKQWEDRDVPIVKRDTDNRIK